MEQYTNANKSIHGQEAKKQLLTSLNQTKEFSYISEIKIDYRCGYPEYDNKQFYSNFVIVFEDGNEWIINITTSLRTDRVKENQWDSYNIKAIDKKITKSILVFPDSLNTEEKEKFITYKLKVENHIHYSAIDLVLSQNELFEAIQNHALIDQTTGKKKDTQGNNFEIRIAQILNSLSNFEKWKFNSITAVGMNYEFFEKIISKFNLDKTAIKKINATADKSVIGNLLSSGKPKTDLVVYAHYIDENKEPECFTISCKNSTEDYVSVHQYSAQSFCDVLDSENIELKKLLLEFQKNGNLRDFGSENAEKLTNELKPYLKNLVRWVIGGYGGKIKNKLQLADFILIYDGIDVYIHTLDKYTDFLLQNEIKGHFGTPFRWTYASGRKGKDIQLKCKIIKQSE